MTGMILQPTQQQHRAADPYRSVWVTASAGTGKTRVLTNRVLRLLMTGAGPESILCLTYTKAAASEMTSRIMTDLAAWAGESDDKVLSEKLSALSGNVTEPDDLRRARRLFDDVLACPEGMRVQTIHSLCESLLRRFPLEADIPVHFDVIDDQQAAELRKDTLRKFLREPPAHLEAHIERTALLLDEHGLQSVMELDAKHRSWIDTLNQDPSPSSRAFRSLATALGFPELLSPDYAAGSSLDDAPSDATLREWQQVLAAETKSKTMVKIGAKLDAWLSLSGDERSHRSSEYEGLFLKQDGTPPKSVVVKAISTAYPDIAEAMQNEALRLAAHLKRESANELFTYSRSILLVTAALHAAYSSAKHDRGFLDFSDQIEKARYLLCDAAEADWIRYRLDASFDHILVDEAQDTSKTQWQIIEALASDFFDREPEAGRMRRTLFVVGDEKQSIFSFQGADRKVFNDMRETFQRKASERNVPFDLVTLNESFRTTETILSFVDRTFADEESATGVSHDNQRLEHISFRKGEYGRVAVWPIPSYRSRLGMSVDDMLTADSAEDTHDPDAAAYIKPAERAVNAVARWIADRIRAQVILPSTKRPMRPGDVLILMPSRAALPQLLVNACQKLDLPVAGQDRLKLSESLAVKDLVALGDACLLPQDDLTFAILLRSPIIGLSEADLFRLCHDRGNQTVFRRLQLMADGGDPVFAEAYRLVSDFLQKADFYPPYDFYTELLGKGGLRKRLMSRLGYAIDEAIETFLTQCLNYERGRVPTLQGFLHWFKSDDSDIKRDPEDAGNAVRMMTVHSSKGLEAPVVVLMNTAYTPKPRHEDRLQFIKGCELPVWRVGEKDKLKIIDALTETIDDEARASWEERKRLLYVAMTRSRDELHMIGWPGQPNGTGALPKGFHDKEHWHALVHRGMESSTDKSTPFEEPDIDPQIEDCHGAVVSHGLRPEWNTEAEPVQTPGIALPTPSQPAREEPLVLATLSPSAMGSTERAQKDDAEPHDTSRTDALKRGSVIHELLRHLPDQPSERRLTFARDWLTSHLPDEDVPSIEREAHQLASLLEMPALESLFAQGSRAEVPISGSMIVDGHERMISGVIDRIAVLPDEVVFADFKTDRFAPKVMQDIHPAYVDQLMVYHTLVSAIFPDIPIRTALIYTENVSVFWFDHRDLSSHSKISMSIVSEK